jgi:hypothetical protein
VIFHNLTDEQETQASLKVFNSAAHRGFLVATGDQNHFKLDWYESAGIELDDMLLKADFTTCD